METRGIRKQAEEVLPSMSLGLAERRTESRREKESSDLEGARNGRRRSWKWFASRLLEL